MGVGEDALVARVALEGEPAVRLGEVDPLLLLVDDDERHLASRQFPGQGLPDAAIAADDDVAVDRVDLPRFAMFFHGFSDLSFGDDPEQGADKVTGAGESGDDDEDGRRPQFAGVDGVDLPVADAGHGDDDHVEGVRKRPSLVHVSSRSSADHREEQRRADIKLSHPLPR